MIEIIFSKLSVNEYELKIKGHSCSAEKGENIICAAVSVLAQTFISGCEAKLNAKVLGILESGNCDVRVSVPDTKAKELHAVYDVINFGFRKLVESYPKHIKLN